MVFLAAFGVSDKSLKTSKRKPVNVSFLRYCGLSRRKCIDVFSNPFLVINVWSFVFDSPDAKLVLGGNALAVGDR